ncbi:MAG: hypothetical protein AVDCRST_MAG72-719 [uncultured Nocardioidaceae bacterium]|uniref:LamG-like jellyroll fold domain-containing protein n=1 Tax=uncultured Nocardioidaceae bacterium TaxID=253824 RepID=A0A6J4LQ26_9ACTN|nr:MAG: hypothetical protein AVDCRST_MAG72-719 [uncultured Nocardioidaceae bacterium]
MRRSSAVGRLVLVLAALSVILAGQAAASFSATTSATTSSSVTSRYERTVLADRPAAFLQRGRDITGRGGNGVFVGAYRTTHLPNGDPAVAFAGRGQFLRFADRPAFRVTSRGVLTVEYWIRPDTLQFSDEEGSGYVYLLGKGDPGQHEWYGRMYSRVNAESRPNRLSGYAFNSSGGLGAGSYFQDAVVLGRWIHVVLVINSVHKSRQYPMGYTKIYKNGDLRDKDSLADYDIRPRSGDSPLRIGTGYRDSFFEGAVGDVAFYKYELSATRVRTHADAM